MWRFAAVDGCELLGWSAGRLWGGHRGPLLGGSGSGGCKGRWMQCATMEQLRSGANVQRWEGRLLGPHLPQAVRTRCSSGRPGKVPAAPGAAWERAALLVCHSCLGQGTGILSRGRFANTVVLHRNSLGPSEPHGKSQPCKLGQEQLKAWGRLVPAARCQRARRWACCASLPPTHAAPQGLRGWGGRGKGTMRGPVQPWLEGWRTGLPSAVVACLHGVGLQYPSSNVFLALRFLGQSDESHIRLRVRIGLREVLRSVFCFSAVPQIQILFCCAVPQEGLTVTSSSLDLGGFEEGLIPSNLFFPALFSSARAAVSFGKNALFHIMAQLCPVLHKASLLQTSGSLYLRRPFYG